MELADRKRSCHNWLWPSQVVSSHPVLLYTGLWITGRRAFSSKHWLFWLRHEYYNQAKIPLHKFPQDNGWALVKYLYTYYCFAYCRCSRAEFAVVLLIGLKVNLLQHLDMTDKRKWQVKLCYICTETWITFFYRIFYWYTDLSTLVIKPTDLYYYIVCNIFCNRDNVATAFYWVHN